MSFSALNIGRQMIVQTGNFLPSSKIPSKPQAGGSYTPNTLEAIYVLRSSLDYQFETAFLTKYKALMQNRLNTLTDQLKSAYTNLLNSAMGQQVGERADAALRADTRIDGMGTSLIQGIQGATGFEDIGVDPDTDNTWRTTLAKGLDLMKEGRLLPDDGLAGYSRNLGNGGTAVQFRALTEYITAASNIGGNLNITMRAEDDPPEIDPGNVILAALGKIISLAMGGPADPTKFNQKLEQHTTDFKTGGFWSAVNYLYNFAPREINYSYAVGYTVNSNEAGDTDYLVNGRFVDTRDRVGGTTTINEPIYEVTNYYSRPAPNPDDEPIPVLITAPPAFAGLQAIVSYPTDSAGNQTGPTPNKVVRVVGSTAQPADGTLLSFDFGGSIAFESDGPTQVGTRTYTGDASQATGNRAKWASFDPTEGYQHEYSGTSGLNPDGSSNSNAARYTSVINRQRVWVSGTDDQGTPVWYTTADSARGQVNVLDNIAFRSGTDIFIPGQGLWTDVGYAYSNIQAGSIFKHTVGPGATATEGPTDERVTRPNTITSSLFFNHYEVETRTVDFNNDARRDATGFDGVSTHDNRGQLYVYGDIERSTAVDASKSFEWIDEDGNGTAGTILRNTGSPSKSFNGDFVQGLHKIHSVNGQSVVGNEQKQASPIIGNFELGRYEGIMRSYEMSRHLIPYTPPKTLEVNAADTVPTDWYQAEMIMTSANPATVRDSGIWFPYVDDTIYSNGSSGSYGGGNGPRMVVQARNTFNLKREDFLQLAPVGDWVEDATGFLRPTYEKKDIPVRISLNGVYNPAGDPSAQPKIFVNGINIFEEPYFSDDGNGIRNAVLVSSTGPGTDSASNMVYEVNLSAYLREGINTISIQAGDTVGSDEGISVTALSTMDTQDSSGGAVTLNADAYTLGLVQGIIATGYGDMGNVVYNNQMSRPNTVRVQSRWQTRIVPSTTLDDNNSNLLRAASSPEQTGSSAKTTNSFLELIIDALNQRKYRDIFKLGLLSNLNKMAIQGQANVPTGASLQGNVTVYFDTQSQRLVVNQDKLVGKS